MYFDDCMTIDDVMKKMTEIQKCYTDRVIKLSGGVARRKKTKVLNKSYTPTNSPRGQVTIKKGSPCCRPGYVEFEGLCPLHGRNLKNKEQETCSTEEEIEMKRQIINKKNPCHVTFIDDGDPRVVVEDTGGRVGLDLEIQGLFTGDYKQWKPEMGASAMVWLKMRPNKFSELSWKNKSSYSLVKLESPTLADYLWKKETKKLGSVICNGHIYRVKYQKFRVEEYDEYEDVIPLDGVVEG